MKTIIIEDEKIAADNLEQMLTEIDASIKVMAKIESVRDAVAWLTVNTADLIFLDIHLSDGLSFKIFEQIDVKIPIIFTTAYDQYAIKAFKTNSIDYLLKPIESDELKAAIIKYNTLFSERNKPEQFIDIQKILNTFQSKPEYQKRFVVHAADKIKTIKTEEIAYFFASEKNVFLKTFDNHTFDVDYTLDVLELQLNSDQFFRINRSFLINIDAINQMHHLAKSRIKIDLKPSVKEEILVSIQRTSEFRNWLNK